jgi:hypothetical protein
MRIRSSPVLITVQQRFRFLLAEFAEKELISMLQATMLPKQATAAPSQVIKQFSRYSMFAMLVRESLPEMSCSLNRSFHRSVLAERYAQVRWGGPALRTAWRDDLRKGRCGPTGEAQSQDEIPKSRVRGQVGLGVSE